MVLKEEVLEESVVCYFDSSNILCVKYNIQERKMAVIFGDGRQYVYEGVIPYHFQRFKLSKSTGVGLKEHIVKNYVGSKVEKKLENEKLFEIKQFIESLKPIYS